MGLHGGRGTAHRACEQGSALAEALRERAAKAVAGRSGPARRALVVVGLDPLVAAGPESFSADVLRSAGYVNALEGGGDAYPVSPWKRSRRPTRRSWSSPTERFPVVRLCALRDRAIALAAPRSPGVAIPADLLVRPGPARWTPWSGSRRPSGAKGGAAVTAREWRAVGLGVGGPLPLAAALFLGLPAGAGPALLWGVRVPEALTAAFVGGALGLSGLLFQLVLRNGLADPTSWAWRAAPLSAPWWPSSPWARRHPPAGLPLESRGGLRGGPRSRSSASSSSARASPRPLLLGGVIGQHGLRGPLEGHHGLVFPRAAGLRHRLPRGFHPHAAPLGAPPAGRPGALHAGRASPPGARGLDLLLLSDDEAASLGLAVHKVRREALVLATLLAASAVALCGMVGFVGLVVPHAARLAAGRRHRVLVPASFLLGAAFLLAAHALGKLLAGSWFLPVGVYTSLVGAPVFLVLLLGGQRRDGAVIRLTGARSLSGRKAAPGGMRSGRRRPGRGGGARGAQRLGKDDPPEARRGTSHAPSGGTVALEGKPLWTWEQGGPGQAPRLCAPDARSCRRTGP